MNQWIHHFAQEIDPTSGAPSENAKDPNRTIFIVPDSKLEWLNKKIESLNKVAKKLGTQPVGYKVLEQNIAQTNVNQDWAETGNTDQSLVSDVRTATKIEIFGEAPSIKGWKFVSRILHGEDGNILKTVPGEALPPQFRTVVPQCQHCGYRRRRNDTFVLKNEATEEYKQVGSNCLSDFLGHASPGLYASFAENMADFSSELSALEDDWEGGRGGGFSRSIDIRYYLRMVYAIIKRYGWLGRGAASEVGKAATADQALNLIYSRDQETIKKRDAAIQELSTDDKQMLSDALAWARSLKDGSDEQKDQLSDYYWNLAVACSQDRVKKSTEGIVASLPIAYDKAVLKTIRPDKVNAVGEKGQTVVVKGTVAEEKSVDGHVVYDIMTNDNKMVRATFPSEQQLQGKEVVLEGVITGFTRKFNYVVSSLSRVKFLNADQFEIRQQEVSKEQQQAAQGPKPEYVVGEKVTANLTILKMKEMETQYGMTTLVSMVDDFGMSVKWWASNPKELTEGEKVNMTFTVKNVGAYNGVPDVTITRPKINSRAMEEGSDDARLTVSEANAIKKQIKSIQSEFEGLLFGYEVSIDEYSPVQELLKVQEDMVKAIQSVFPVDYYYLSSVKKENAFNGNAEQFVEATIDSLKRQAGTVRTFEQFMETKKYKQFSLDSERQRFETFKDKLSNSVSEVEKAQSTFNHPGWMSSVIRNIFSSSPSVFQKVVRMHEGGNNIEMVFYNLDRSQWLDKFNEVLTKYIPLTEQQYEIEKQNIITESQEEYNKEVQIINKKNQEAQEIEQNKEGYVQKLNEIARTTSIGKYLETAPRRNQLHATYRDLRNKLSESAAAVKLYGPKAKRANWIYRLIAS